jgi:transcriptional regulator with PAS, ATPase and Fis domain
MDQVQRLVALSAPTNMTVLILGETGVGKDVLAEQIHRASPRKGRTFLRLNCAALSETLLESELFGHEKGAFTGAVQAKPGLLEAAHGGTLLLDEVAEMPLPIQAKLLVAIERREVLRLGSVTPRGIDVRFLAATNQDVDARVASGAFRRDLLYRLNGVAIRVPPLRARKNEIDALAAEFVALVCRETGREPLRIENDALALMRAQPYPGNIRELRSLIERAVAFAKNSIDLSTLDLALGAGVGGSAHPPAQSALRLEMRHLECERIVEALDRCDGNQTKAAALLGIPRRTLVRRLSQFGITWRRGGNR